MFGCRLSFTHPQACTSAAAPRRTPLVPPRSRPVEPPAQPAVWQARQAPCRCRTPFLVAPEHNTSVALRPPALPSLPHHPPHLAPEQPLVQLRCRWRTRDGRRQPGAHATGDATGERAGGGPSSRLPGARALAVVPSCRWRRQLPAHCAAGGGRPLPRAAGPAGP